MSYGVMKKKTTEKEKSRRLCQCALTGHEEVGGVDVTTELGGIAKGMVASAAGESDFSRGFSVRRACRPCRLEAAAHPPS